MDARRTFETPLIIYHSTRCKFLHIIQIINYTALITSNVASVQEFRSSGGWKFGKRLAILCALTVISESEAHVLNICISKYRLPSDCGLISDAIFVATLRSEAVSRLDHFSIINRLQAASKASANTEKWASLLCPCQASQMLQRGINICKLGEKIYVKIVLLL